jgi:hypothetical protein
LNFKLENFIQFFFSYLFNIEKLGHLGKILKENYNLFDVMKAGRKFKLAPTMFYF